MMRRVTSMAGRWATWLGRLSMLLGLAMLAGVVQAASGPSVRVQVLGKQPVLVGQQVEVEVTVSAPNFFLSAPPFPALVVPGAIVTMPNERGVHGVDTVDGQTLASIQKTYVFTAQQAGDFDLPPVKIEFSYQGDDNKPQQASLTLPATRISAQLPAGASAAAAGSPVMPATRLSIRQSLDRDPEQLGAGDALVRTVQIQAPNAPAMLIPPPHFEAPSGVRMYQADPVLRDADGQGDSFAGGVRIEQVSYVFEKAGRYTLPAVEIQWLDPQTQKPVTVQAPAVKVQVKAGADAGERIAPELPVGAAQAAPRRPIDWMAVALWAAGVAVLAALALWVGSRWPRWQHDQIQRRLAHAGSDRAMFDAVLSACQDGNARAAHAALLAWSRTHALGTPQAWAASLGDAAAARQIEQLGRQLYRKADAQAGPAWSGTDCAAALRAAHQQWLLRSSAGAQRHRWGRALGPLNP